MKDPKIVCKTHQRSATDIYGSFKRLKAKFGMANHMVHVRKLLITHFHVSLCYDVIMNVFLIVFVMQCGKAAEHNVVGWRLIRYRQFFGYFDTFLLSCLVGWGGVITS